MSRWPRLAAVLLAVMAIGCSDSISPRNVDPLVQQVVDMGFNPREIVDRGEYFLVEGDIVIWKRHLRGTLDDEEPSAQDPLRPIFQWRTNNLVALQVVPSLRVSISPQLSQSWQDATRAAMVEWTAITGVAVQFVEDAPAHITVSPSGTIDAIAQASFPANGNPGPTIHVSTDPDFEEYNADQKLFIMAHEFGHTIGFRHSNWHLNSGPNCGTEQTAIRIGITDSTDAASVMNKCSGGLEWIGFSVGDIDAARILYNDQSTLTSTTQQNGDRLVTWTSVVAAASYWLVATYRRCWYDYEFGYMCDPDVVDWRSITGNQYLDTKPSIYNPWGYPGEECWVEYLTYPRYPKGDGMLRSNIDLEYPAAQPCGW